MIYTFYSYKGGVGRTLSLVHAGIRLAMMRRKAGYKVLLVDMDLEAPGLEAYFPIQRPQKAQGFAGLLKGYQSNGRKLSWLEGALADGDFIVPVSGTKNLFIMPSGIKAQQEGGHTYQDVNLALRREMPNKRLPELPKEGFFADLRNALNQRFTYVLVDSRTGLTDQAYASTLLLGDILVLCFRLNQINIEGIQKVFGNFLLREKRRVGEPSLPVISVASPVPPRAGTDIENWVSAATEVFLGSSKREDSRDELSRLFPQIHRMFHEPSLEVGEKLVFDHKGALKKGFSELTPIVGSINRLTEHISALNSDKDVESADAIEKRLYNQESKPDAALPYLFRQIRLEPFEANHWSDLTAGYISQTPKLREKAERALEELIKDWRKDVDSQNPCENSIHARRLGYALKAWVEGFGKSQVDAGYSVAREALTLCCNDRFLERHCHWLTGQIIDEIVKVRKAASRVFGEQGDEKQSIRQAIKHYTRCIQLVERIDGENQLKRAYLDRARDFHWLKENRKALADFDAYVAGGKKPDSEVDEGSATALTEEADLLKSMGRFDLAFQNYRAASQVKSPDSEILQYAYLCASRLQLTDYAERLFHDWEHAESSDNKSKVHRHRAVSLMVQRQFERALRESRIAASYSDRPRLRIVEVLINLLRERFDEAASIAEVVMKSSDDSYARSICAVAAALGKKEVKASLIPNAADDQNHVCVIAALALRDWKLAKQILFKQQALEEDAEDRALFLALRIACPAVDSNERKQALEQLLSMFKSLPYFAVAFRNYPEACLFRFVCRHLEDGKHRLPQEISATLRNVWKQIGSYRAPKLSQLPPRSLKKSLTVRTLL